MKLLRNRTFAVALTALVVVLSVVFGAGRSVRALRSEVVTYFEYGANGVNSVQKDLTASAATAANLCVVAARYLPASDELSALQHICANAASGGEFAGTYDDYVSLYQTAGRLMDELEQETLSEQDAKYIKSFRTELESRKYGISSDPYNDMAREFEQTLYAFPLRLLRPLLFVDDLYAYDRS